MFALSFRFPAGQYHGTPWSRNVNEADIAWPPEPWRLLRTLIAAWWRKGDRDRWSTEDLGRLIEQLAATLPEYLLPTGAIHAHTRHYMPTAKLAPKGQPETELVFDAFVRLAPDAVLVAAWPDLTLDSATFSLGADLAGAIGYLGRTESWTQCEALAEWAGTANCRPQDVSSEGLPVRLLAPRTPRDYAAERARLLEERRSQLLASSGRPISPGEIEKRLDKDLRGKKGQAHTLPKRLVDALTLDPADYRNRGWSRPPAAREVVYTREPDTVPRVVARLPAVRSRRARTEPRPPTVARFLLAGRPLPRIEDAVRIGELMRRAALAQFGWRRDERQGKEHWIPKAPWTISGRDADGKPLRDPTHQHAFWLPEDTDGDGWIDHVSVFVRDGMDPGVRARLDRITKLWLSPKQGSDEADAEPVPTREWRLALEGFGHPADFAGDARIFGASRRWRSATPFLASGHLKAAGYRGEVRRLLRLRKFAGNDIDVTILPSITVGGAPRRAIHFHRFRSRGREAQPDAAGALLEIEFPDETPGPLAIGYGSHFGLGLFLPIGPRDHSSHPSPLPGTVMAPHEPPQRLRSSCQPRNGRRSGDSMTSH